MGIVRYWARLRGERCLATIVDISAPHAPGHVLVVGNRAYMVTRVLRGRGGSRQAACTWEIWARRMVNKQ